MIEEHRDYPAIGEYAIIGDCRSAALISREGSLDWLCLPRFDSPSVFAAILDARRGGRFTIRPTGRFACERRYIDRTPVLETRFRTGSGTVRLVDLMPVASEAEKRRALHPDHEILRVVECVDGEVEVEAICDPRPDYACTRSRLVRRGRLGLYYERGGDLLTLRSDGPVSLSEDRSGASARMTLRAGDRCRFSLIWTQGEPAVLTPLGDAAEDRIERSIRWWRDWVGSCEYEGPYRDAVVRSAITLKLLTYAPSGAVVAAPTTSLPERIGGVRNWDYRFCWLRDASLTLQALFDLGYWPEGEAFVSWLLHTTRMSWPELQVVYDVFGETRLRERELDHLDGYAGSRPVRVGNGAQEQFQLDTYGEVADAVYEFVIRGGRVDRPTRRLLTGLGRTVCRRWREPDEGIWEVRRGRRHHTYSKAMCWVALDRLIQLHETGHVDGPTDRLRREREAIRRDIDLHGWNPELESYVAVYGTEEVDASLLLLARYRYEEPTSPRILSTCRRVHERLAENGFLYRYVADDGLPPGEGAFGICNFWAVECMARQGRVDAACEFFERLLGLANDVGLLAEEFDPVTGRQLGNFPQAFTHVGLIDAALALSGEADEVGQRESARRETVAGGRR